MSNKNKTKSFTKMLKENAKKITIMVKDEERTLASLMDESVEETIATSMDGIIPATAEEAATDSLNSNMLGISVNYVQTAFSMYESSLKYQSAKQTMIITLPASSADEIFDCSIPEFNSLIARTDLALVLDKIPEKLKKRTLKFAEDDESNDMFVLKIPNIVMFYDSIRKREASKAKFFDIVVILVRTKKSLNKIKKKDKEGFKELSSNIVEKTVDLMADLGVSCAHVTLDPMFFIDPHDYASASVKYLDAKDASKKLLSRIVFCTMDADTLAQFNGQLRAELSANKGIEAL